MINNNQDLIKDAQNEMKYMLEKLVNFLDDNNISYWIDSGTLLGSVRHSGFIPWDDDIDICMLREDYNRFINTNLSEVYEDLYIDIGAYDKNMILWSKVKSKSVLIEEKDKPNEKQNIFIDIFPVDIVPNKLTDRILKKLSRFIILTNWKKRSNIEKANYLKIYNKLSNCILKNIKKIYISKFNNGDTVSYGIETPFLNSWEFDNIFPLNKCTFEGIETYCPSNLDKYLTKLYGNDYMKLPPKEKREAPHIKNIIKIKE